MGALIPHKLSMKYRLQNAPCTFLFSWEGLLLLSVARQPKKTIAKIKNPVQPLFSPCSAPVRHDHAVPAGFLGLVERLIGHVNQL